MLPIPSMLRTYRYGSYLSEFIVKTTLIVLGQVRPIAHDLALQVR